MNSTEIMIGVKTFLKKNDFTMEDMKDGNGIFIKYEDNPIVVSLEKSSRHSLYVLLDCNLANHKQTRHRRTIVVINNILEIFKTNRLDKHNIKLKEVNHDS